MKAFNKKMFIVSLILLIIIQILLNYKLKKQLTSCINSSEYLYDQFIDYKSDYLASLKIEQLQIPEIELVFKDVNDQFVIIFPENICDVCTQKIFEDIKELSISTKNRIIAIIPPKFKRNFSIYNKKYELGLNSIIYTSAFSEISRLANDNMVICYYSSLNIKAPMILKSKFSNLRQYIDIFER